MLDCFDRMKHTKEEIRVLNGEISVEAKWFVSDVTVHSFRLSMERNTM